jgi:hypothetical protein
MSGLDEFFGESYVPPGQGYDITDVMPQSEDFSDTSALSLEELVPKDKGLPVIDVIMYGKEILESLQEKQESIRCECAYLDPRKTFLDNKHLVVGGAFIGIGTDAQAITARHLDQLGRAIYFMAKGRELYLPNTRFHCKPMARRVHDPLLADIISACLSPDASYKSISGKLDECANGIMPAYEQSSKDNLAIE